MINNRQKRSQLVTPKVREKFIEPIHQLLRGADQMIEKSDSFCPFRVQTPDHQAGCTLLIGLNARCYTQERRPLIRKFNFFICPILGIHLGLELCNQLTLFLKPILQIQDEFEIAINVWPTLKGIANSQGTAESLSGANLVELAISIQEALNEIILEQN